MILKTLLVALSLLVAPVQTTTTSVLPPATEETKIVYVDMVADLFHAGHENFLQQAIVCGEEEFSGKKIKLIVGLVSDEDAAPYKRRPIMTLAERVRAVSFSKIGPFDDIIEGSPIDGIPSEFIEEHKIDLVVHGDDYTDEQVEKYYGAVREIFRTVPYTKGVSTSEIIANVKNHIADGTSLDEELIGKINFTDSFTREMLVERVRERSFPDSDS